jgi:hypothetical protein
MKLRYYPETDSLYIELNGTPGPKRARSSRVWSSISTPMATWSDSTSSTLRTNLIYRRWRPSRCRRRVLRSDIATTGAGAFENCRKLSLHAISALWLHASSNRRQGSVLGPDA